MALMVSMMTASNPQITLLMPVLQSPLLSMPEAGLSTAPRHALVCIMYLRHKLTKMPKIRHYYINRGTQKIAAEVAAIAKKYFHQ